MSNKKSGAGFYVTIALIVVVLAAIIYIVVTGSMPKGADVPEDLTATDGVETTETKSEEAEVTEEAAEETEDVAEEATEEVAE